MSALQTPMSGAQTPMSRDSEREKAEVNEQLPQSLAAQGPATSLISNEGSR